MAPRAGEGRERRRQARKRLQRERRRNQRPQKPRRWTRGRQRIPEGDVVEVDGMKFLQTLTDSKSSLDTAETLITRG